MRKVVVWLGILQCLGCGGGAARARQQILKQDAPAIVTSAETVTSHYATGLRRAAERLSIGFVRSGGEQRREDMHRALHLVRSFSRGIPALTEPQIAFIAAVNSDGTWLATDLEPDPVATLDPTASLAPVSSALAGEQRVGIGVLRGLPTADSAAPLWLVALPARYDGRVVGAFVLGIALAQLQTALMTEHKSQLSSPETADALGVYLYRGDEIYQPSKRSVLDRVVPDAPQRRQGLVRSAGGFTGELREGGRWYGFGVRPLPVLGPDAGVVIVRAQSS